MYLSINSLNNKQVLVYILGFQGIIVYNLSIKCILIYNLSIRRRLVYKFDFKTTLVLNSVKQVVYYIREPIKLKGGKESTAFNIF